jgi:putative membrane protein
MSKEDLSMKKYFAYGMAVLALTAAPLFAQVGSGTSGQGRVTPVPNTASQPPVTGGATDQGGSRPGGATPEDSAPAQPNAPTGSGARAGKDPDPAKSAQDEKNSGRASAADQSFVIEAARGGMAEVELGKLATRNASNARVKQFAERMAADHGKANAELKSLAESKGITIPMDLGETHKETRDRLAKLSGTAFDNAYIQAMVADHEEDVLAFQKESASGTDPAVKAFAARTLPTLEAHMKMVREISQSLGRTGVGTSGKIPE